MKACLSWMRTADCGGTWVPNIWQTQLKGRMQRQTCLGNFMERQELNVPELPPAWIWASDHTGGLFWTHCCFDCSTSGYRAGALTSCEQAQSCGSVRWAQTNWPAGAAFGSVQCEHGLVLCSLPHVGEKKQQKKTTPTPPHCSATDQWASMAN